MNEDVFKSLWAKSDPHHPLWCHLFDVAAACEALLARFGAVDGLPPRWVAFLAGTHDIGKADDWFQNKDDREGGYAEQLRKLVSDLPQRGDALTEPQRKFRHEARSAEWLKQWLEAEHGWQRHAANVVMSAIRGHHGDFAASGYDEEGRATFWDEYRRALVQRLWDVLQPSPLTLSEFEHASAAGIKLSGLIVLADWLASNHELYRYQELARGLAPAAYWEVTRRRAGEVVTALEFGGSTPDSAVAPAAPAAPLPFGAVWPQRADTMRPSQRALESEVLRGVAPGLCLIEAPMGEGKTEAAVYLAEEWNRQTGQQGVYLALPTQATSNQMHERYEQFLAERGVAKPRLVHGMAWLVDQVVAATGDSAPRLREHSDTAAASRDEELAREWFRPLRRALLAPYGVGTVDQALMAALHVKFGFLRLLGLTTKTLIVDEVHAYDDYMTTILEQLLQWCGALHINVILLSATLSNRQKTRLVAAYQGKSAPRLGAPSPRDASPSTAAHQEPYPLLTFVPRGEAERTVRVERDPMRDRELILHSHPRLLEDAERTAALALELVREGGNLCVLCNTVASAQQVFKHLQAADTEARLFLFHARFRAGERDRIEKEIKGAFGPLKEGEEDARPSQSIVVATQVVEQSLDVDFDYMVSQVAPVDLLLQRSGRLHRHDPRTRPAALPPTLHILLPDAGTLQFGSTEKVYARETLLRTFALLHGKDAWHLPADFRPLIEACYGDALLPEDVVPLELLEAAAQKREDDATVATAKARTHLLPAPNDRVFQLSRMPVGEAEGEGGTSDYFRASTRLGDASQAVIVLEDARLIALAESSRQDDARPPRRADLEALFRCKVNLPTWWLREAVPTANSSPAFEGDHWLRFMTILPLKGDAWHGLKGGKPFTIRNDKKLGLVRETEPNQRSSDAEVDAGYTG